VGPNPPFRTRGGTAVHKQLPSQFQLQFTIKSPSHVGVVISGRATAAMWDGSVFEMSPGDVFYVPPGHDIWVVGDEPYVSIHLLGAADYAKHATYSGCPVAVEGNQSA
jgi:mannose-6-phosphate isomerase-like protein (cupin superfamily)